MCTVAPGWDVQQPQRRLQRNNTRHVQTRRQPCSFATGPPCLFRHWHRDLEVTEIGPLLQHTWAWALLSPLHPKGFLPDGYRSWEWADCPAIEARDEAADATSEEGKEWYSLFQKLAGKLRCESGRDVDGEDEWGEDDRSEISYICQNGRAGFRYRIRFPEGGHHINEGRAPWPHIWRPRPHWRGVGLKGQGHVFFWRLRQAIHDEILAWREWPSVWIGANLRQFFGWCLPALAWYQK